MKTMDGSSMIFEQLKNKVLLPALAALTMLIPNSSKSYEAGSLEKPNCHPLITAQAFEFYNQDAEEGKKLYSENNFSGSIDEDTPPRWLNHFRDWRTGKGIWGFDSALEWALNPDAQNGPIISVDKIPQKYQSFYQALLDLCDCGNYPEGDQSWSKAKSDLQAGKSTPALEYVLHLNEDMSVAAHAWGDVHIIRVVDSLKTLSLSWSGIDFSRVGDLYEYYTSQHLELISQNPPKVHRKFNSLEEIFTELSTFTGQNFASDDTMDEFLALHPDLEEEKIGGKTYKINYIDGEKIHVARKNLLGWGLDEVCLNDYASVLIPRAAEYAAAVIDLAMNDSQTSNCQPLQSYTDCSGNAVWWFDACNNPSQKIESCDNGCSNGVCNDQNCISHANKVCDNFNNSYWYDSCGNLEEWIELCENGCYNNGECNNSGTNECLDENCTFYDDFSGDLSQWDILGGTPEISNGKLIIDEGDAVEIKKNIPFNNPVEYKSRLEGEEKGYVFLRVGNSGDITYDPLTLGTNKVLFHCNYNSGEKLIPVSIYDWHIIKVEPTGNSLSVYVNGGFGGTVSCPYDLKDSILRFKSDSKNLLSIDYVKIE